jgi:hypothetical protein
MKKESNIEDKIKEYLSNKEKSLDAHFTQSVLNQIGSMDKNGITDKKKISFCPVAFIGFAICLLCIFILNYPKPDHIVNLKHDGIRDDLMTTTLEDPEQVMLEDLMSIPEEFDSSEILFSEETYELLVLLDY